MMIAYHFVSFLISFAILISAFSAVRRNEIFYKKESRDQLFPIFLLGRSRKPDEHERVGGYKEVSSVRFKGFPSPFSKKKSSR